MVRLRKVPSRNPRTKKEYSFKVKSVLTVACLVGFVLITRSRSNDLNSMLVLVHPPDNTELLDNKELLDLQNEAKVEEIKQEKIKQAQELLAAQQQARAQQQQQPQQQPQELQPPPPASNAQLPVILERSDLLYQKGTWDKAPIIIEKYKLVFFTVPKVGCTEFKKLFRRMMGYPNWKEHQYFNQPFLPHNPDTNGLKYLSDFPFEKANEMLTSSEWTRAIFVREPQQRVLSAYLDKAAYSQGFYLRMQCCQRLRPGSVPYNLINCATGTKWYTQPQPGEESSPKPILSFEDYLSQIVPKCPDPHWERQSTRMAPKYWEQINFVGRFENLYEDTKQLLTQIGAWEEYGASGWGSSQDDAATAIFDPSNKVTHGTNAQDKSSASQYFTPEAKRYILEYYAPDYEHNVLKFTKPER